MTEMPRSALVSAKRATGARDGTEVITACLLLMSALSLATRNAVLRKRVGSRSNASVTANITMKSGWRYSPISGDNQKFKRLEIQETEFGLFFYLFYFQSRRLVVGLIYEKVLGMK